MPCRSILAFAAPAMVVLCGMALQYTAAADGGLNLQSPYAVADLAKRHKPAAGPRTYTAPLRRNSPVGSYDACVNECYVFIYHQCRSLFHQNCDSGMPRCINQCIQQYPNGGASPG